MAVATVLSLAAVIVAPVLVDQLFSEIQLDFKVIWSCWFVVLAQAFIAIGGVLFFYEGLPRRQQFRILSMFLAFVFVFATICNTIYGNELCEILSRGEMIIHLAAWGAVNIAAMICTLFVYRLEPIKVEIGSPAAVPSTPLWLSIPPAAVPVIFAAIAIALIPLAPNLLPRDKSLFRCTVPFFIGGQILFGIVTANWLLTKKTWPQKIRHALMIVATSMFFGTLCNIINVRSTLRPGFRIEISAGEYILMNLAAMLCVIGYFVWERIRNGELAKRAELLAATQAGSAAASPTSAPSAAVSQSAQPPSTSTPPAISDRTELAPTPAPPATPDDILVSSSEASPAVSLSLKTEHAEPITAATSKSSDAGSSSSVESSSPPIDSQSSAAETSSTPEAKTSAKGQSSSPNKGPSKKQKSGSSKNAGSQKSGSPEGGSTKNNGTPKNGSAKKSDNNGKQKGGGQPKSGNNGSSKKG